MTDRELLELAAKAAGLTIDHWAAHNYAVVIDADGNKCGWSPLEFDSDALRLAGDLSFVVNIWNSARKTFAGYAESGEGWTEDHGSDPYAATRRAIVRAAAEIGRQMEEQS